MNIPENITILDGALAMDGGSIWLQVSDPDDCRHSVLLTQHLLPTAVNPNEKKPGRLYFNGELIGVRSEEEISLITALKNAVFIRTDDGDSKAGPSINENPGMIVGDDIREYYSKIEEGPGSALRHLSRELIKYIESKEYIAFAAEHEQ